MKQRIQHVLMGGCALVAAYILWASGQKVTDLQTKVTAHGQQLAGYEQYKVDDNARHIRLAGDVKTLYENGETEKKSRRLKDEEIAENLAAETRARVSEDTSIRTATNNRFTTVEESLKENAADIKDSGLGDLAKQVREKKDGKFKVASREYVDENKPTEIKTEDFFTKEDWRLYQEQLARDKAGEERREENLGKANDKIDAYKPRDPNDPTTRWKKRLPMSAGDGWVRQIIVDDEALDYIPNQPQNLMTPGQPDWYGYLTHPNKPETILQARFWVRHRFVNSQGCWQLGPEVPEWRKVTRKGDYIELHGMPGYHARVKAEGFPDKPDRALSAPPIPPAPNPAPNRTPMPKPPADHRDPPPAPKKVSPPSGAPVAGRSAYGTAPNWRYPTTPSAWGALSDEGNRLGSSNANAIHSQVKKGLDARRNATTSSSGPAANRSPGFAW